MKLFVCGTRRKQIHIHHKNQTSTNIRKEEILKEMKEMKTTKEQSSRRYERNPERNFYFIPRSNENKKRTQVIYPTTHEHQSK